MKRIFPMILAALVASMALVACGGNEKENFERTPEAEYLRMYSYAGEGTTFDFSEHPTFSVTASGTLSGGNITEPIQLSSLYTHDYTGEKNTSYSTYKAVNTLFDNNGVITAFYDDEMETGFQLGASGSYAYLESMYSSGRWSYPSEYGDGDYTNFLAAFPQSADALTRASVKLLDPEYIDSYNGARSGNNFFVEARVKSENIKEFADWLNAFFPLFFLKDTVDAEREWKFFDLTDESFEYSASLELRTTRNMLEEVIVKFNTVSDKRVDLGAYEFSARMMFQSGGVKVKRLSYFSQDHA